MEDQAPIRQGVHDLMANVNGLNIKQFENGETLLHDIHKLNCPSLILLDLGLPGISGLEVLVLLKRKWPEVNVVVFTIFEDDKHVFEALKYGAMGYLLKKDNPEKIYYAILEALEGGVSMSRVIAMKILKTFLPSPNAEVNSLSEREKKVLDCLTVGKLYKEIADMLNISTNTVNAHIQSIYRKLHVQNRSEAIYKYLNNK